MAVRKSSAKGKQTNLRHLWLASLGAVVVAHREAGSAVAGAVNGACRLRGRAAAVATDATSVARGVLLQARERAGSGLAPLLEGLGRARRKPAARKQARRPARKPAAGKKPASRPVSARKRAERRVASRGR